MGSLSLTTTSISPSSSTSNGSRLCVHATSDIGVYPHAEPSLGLTGARNQPIVDGLTFPPPMMSESPSRSTSATATLSHRCPATEAARVTEDHAAGSSRRAGSVDAPSGAKKIVIFLHSQAVTTSRLPSWSTSAKIASSTP
jgi:hypothetical protein